MTERSRFPGILGVDQCQPDHHLGRLPPCPSRQGAPCRRVLGVSLSARANRSSCSDPFRHWERGLCRSRMGLSPILVIGDPSCTRRRSFTQRSRHKRCQGRHGGEIHPGARFDAHPHTSHAVEHPKRHFVPPARVSPVEGASRASRIRLLYDVADPERAAAPGMRWIAHPTGGDPMGGLALGCTIPSAHIRAAASRVGHPPTSSSDACLNPGRQRRTRRRKPPEPPLSEATTVRRIHYLYRQLK